jgi:single-strand DNA-binding protein
MSDSITVRGFVATEIKSSTTPGGVATANFRLGSTNRRFDRNANAWVDGNTNWFTVQGYRQLAGNMGCSIKKGQRVIVVGRLKMRSWEKDGRIYHSAEIDAESVGHDLMWGSANYIRTAGAGGQGAASSTGAAGDEEPHGDDPDEGVDGDRGDAPAIFIDDATGEAEEVDEETGELKGAAA